MSIGLSFPIGARIARVRHRTGFVALPLVLLAACATPYQSRTIFGVGYTDFQIEDDTWQVTYDGDGTMGREVVERYALFRCAELTLEQGYDHFVIIETTGDASSSTRVRTETSTSPEFGGTTTSRTKVSKGTKAFSITRTIKLIKGEKPAGNLYAYDARQVLHNMQSKIER